MLTLIVAICLSFCLALALIKSIFYPFKKEQHNFYLSKSEKKISAFLVLAFFLVSLGFYSFKGEPFTSARPFDKFLTKNLMQLNDKEKLVYLEAVFARNRQDGKLAQQLATAYLKQGDALNALNLYSEALRLEGEKAPLYVGYGLALMAYDNGHISLKAQEAFEKAAQLAPKDIYPRIFIARALAQKGKKKQANAYLETFLKSYPDLPLSEKTKILQIILQEPV